MSEGAGWGRGLMALFGLPKRAIKPRPHRHPPHRHPPTGTPHRHPPIYSRRKSLLSRKETTSSAFLFYTKNNTFPFETFLYLIKSTKWN